MQHHGHGDGGGTGGYRLVTEDTTFTCGVPRTWVFEVHGPNGMPSRYRVQHEKELHLIVVRNDLASFTHVHPERRGDGSWEIELVLALPGAHTAFADVAPDDDSPMTLSLGLHAEGGPDVPFRERLPDRIPVTKVDEYEVELVGEVAVGGSADIEFRITRLLPDFANPLEGSTRPVVGFGE